MHFGRVLNKTGSPKMGNYLFVDASLTSYTGMWIMPYKPQIKCTKKFASLAVRVMDLCFLINTYPYSCF